MRKNAFVLLIIVWLASLQALAISIQTLTINGKPAYELEAGHFAQENSALQFKFKLSSTLKQPVTIEHPTEQSEFIVKIGPIDDYQIALNIQQLLEPEKKPTSSEQASNPLPNSDLSHSENKLWNLRNADIRAVIAEVSRVTAKNFIIDPRVQGKISIVSSTPISNKELYQVFLSMLQVAGYAAVPTGKVIKIIPNIDAKTVSVDALNLLRNPPRGDDMLVQVIPVHYVPAEQLVPVLRPLMPQWSNVAAYSPSNMLILSGRANNIKRLASIISQVDNSSAHDIDMIPLKHALAMDVANTLKDLVKIQTNGGGHNQATLAVDDRSNTILISGSRTERIKLRLLIARLDRQSPNGNNGNTQVVYLSYLRAEDLVPILAGIAQANFSGNVGTTIGSITRAELDSTNPASNLANGSSSTNTINQTAAPVTATVNPAATPNTSAASTQNEGNTKPTVQIIGEPNTNSIILNGPSALIRVLKTVINQLDIRPAQLLIEAMVAEVDESDVNNLGIEWGSNQQIRKGNNFRPGFAIINSKTSTADFQAQLYALARDRKANILSTPSVVVLDNRQAKILVGKQVSVTSTTYPNNASGTAAGSPYTTFDRVNVALHLYVRPQITRGGGIQLQIDQGNDTLDPADTIDANNPTFKISSIVTSVHVDSGDIVVLGGLTQDSLGNDRNRIPILGDIPGLGLLFQHSIRNREKRVLMVFIKPIILKTPQDSVQITGGKYNDLRQYQLEWLRTQEYRKHNKDLLLPALNQVDLPRPFSHPLPPKPAMNKKPHE